MLFIVLAAAGAAIAALSGKAVNDANKANQQAKTAKDTARSKVARAAEEASTLREKIVVYQALQSRGIIGQEHRLDWIEKIRKIKEAHKLLDLNYELGPQQPIKADVVAPSGNAFDIMASPMKLQMALLHEDDLLGLLSDLRNGIQGYIRVNHCDIERAGAAPPAAGPTAQLRAKCDIDWITVREKS
ncbi:hypothetical protein [Georgfuchsia toluolica]|uniref:hypothetical protein n=1 Tax=Georgfuchsia toluolica TaxID=424218 RepID=UPI001C73ABFD|nr:hypothetical protein [Georgfuchsia toluolica]